MPSEWFALVLLLAGFHDPGASVQDVSFLVAMHGFDVTQDGLVAIDGEEWQIVPIGDAWGLALPGAWEAREDQLRMGWDRAVEETERAANVPGPASTEINIDVVGMPSVSVAPPDQVVHLVDGPGGFLLPVGGP